MITKYYKSLVVFLYLSFCAVITVQAQCPTPPAGSKACHEREMRNINFAYTGGGAAPARWEFSETSAASNGFIFDDAYYAYVPAPTQFGNVALGTGAVTGTEQHAVVTNPSTLNSQFINQNFPNGILVIRPQQDQNENWYSVNIQGLIPGCRYRMEMKVWNLVDYDCSTCGDNGSNWGNFFKTDAANTIFNVTSTGDKSAGNNPTPWITADPNKGSANWNPHGNPINPHPLQSSAGGQSATFFAEVVVPTGNSAFTWAFRKEGGNEKSPIVLGVEYIKIYGCEEEKIVTSTGTNNICENEEVTLTAQGIGSAGSTITWTQTAGATLTTTPVGNKLKVVMPDAGGTATFRAQGEWSYKEITLKSIICCGSGGGSQAEIFKESFNVGINAGQRANIPGLGTTASIGSAYKYSASGNINDGFYAVVRSSCDGGYWCLGHSPAQVNEHTNIAGSGALLVNATASQDYVYRRELTGLCENTLYEFSAYYASLNVGAETPVSLQFDVYAGGSLNVGNSGTLIPDATAKVSPPNVASAGNQPEWYSTKVVFSTAGYPVGTTFYVQIRNSQPGGGGNDFMIDDIAVNKCLPKIDIESGGEKDTLITCSTTGVDLKISAAQSVLNVIATGGGGNVYYQWGESTSPNGPWTKLGGVITLPPTQTASLQTPGYPVGTVRYYQCKISSSAANAADWTLNLNDGCGNDAMSNVFKIEVKSGVTITATTPGSRCGTGTVQIKATTSDGSQVNWYDEATDGVLLGTSNSGVVWTTPSIATTTTYYVEPTNSGCPSARIAVQAVVTPSPSLGIDFGLCLGSTVILEELSSPALPGSWTSLTPGVASISPVTDSTGLVTALAAGTTKIIYSTTSGSCTDTLDLTVYAKPTVNATSNSPVCSGSTLTLTGTVTGATSYQWTGPNNFSSTTLSPSIPNTTSSASGKYKLVATSANGCKDSMEITITINDKPVATATSNTPVCQGSTLTLTGGPAGMSSYAWSKNNTPVGTTATTTITTAATTDAGTYQLIITDTSGCKDTITTTVAITETPTINTLTDQTICSGSSYTTITPSGSTGATFNWKVTTKSATLTGGPALNDTGSGAITGTTLTGEGTLTYTITPTVANGTGTCEGTPGTITITVVATPTVATITNPAAICSGDTFSNTTITASTGSTLTWTATDSPAGTVTGWSIPAAGTTTVTGQTLSTTETDGASVTYTVTPTILAGTNTCTGTAQSFTVTVSPNPTVSGSKTTIAVGESITLTNGVGTSTTGTWTSADDAIVDVDTNGQITGISSGGPVRITYTLDAPNASCYAYIDITVSSIVIGNDSTLYYCPDSGDQLTLVGYAEGVDSYAWYKEGTTEPTSGTPTTADPLIVNYTLGDTTDDLLTTGIWYFKVFNTGTNESAKQKYTITQHDPYTFIVDQDDILSCASATPITLTASLSTGSTLPSGTYTWNPSGTPSTGNTYSLDISNPGTGTITVRGAYTPNPLTPDKQTSRYCYTDETITYEIVDLTISRVGTWPTTAYANTNVTLEISTTGSTLPTGGSLTYQWEESGRTPAGISDGNWTTIGTAATLTDLPNQPDGSCYRVTVTMYDADGTQICTPKTDSHCLSIINIEINKDSTLYYCPNAGDVLTLVGGAKNVDAYAWYKQGDPEPALADATPVPGAPADVTDTHTLNGTDVTAGTWYFKVFSGTNDEKQTFTITQHDNYTFTIAQNPLILECISTTPLTITPVPGTGIPTTGATYSWDPAGTTIPGSTYPAFDISAVTTPGGSSFGVIGQITPNPLNPGDKTSRYCPTSVTVNYQLGQIDVTKPAAPAAWADIVCKGDNTTLTLDNNSTIPAGATQNIKWYSSTTSAAGPWTPLTANNNQTTLAVNNLQQTTYYKIEINMTRKSDNSQMCNIADITHELTVPDFNMPATVPPVGYCVGKNFQLAGTTSSDALSWEWFKDGTSVEAESNNPANKNYPATAKTFASSDAGTYKFVAYNNHCSASTTYTISENSGYTFSVPTEVLTCQTPGGTVAVQATNTSGATNPSYSWSSDNGATGTGNQFNLPVSTAGTGDITVIGTADNKCPVTQTIPYEISNLTIQFAPTNTSITPPVNPTQICKGDSNPSQLQLQLTGIATPNIDYDITWEFRPDNSDTWTPMANGIDPLNQQITTSPTITTSYRATLTIKNKNTNSTICTRPATAPHTLVVLDLGMGDDIVRPLCEKDVYIGFGETQNGTQWQWQDQSGNIIKPIGGGWSANPGDKTISVTGTDDITYYFIARNNQCIDTQQVDIKVTKLIQFDIAASDVQICSGDTKYIPITQTVPTPGTPVNYTWYIDGVNKGIHNGYTFDESTIRTGKIKVEASASGYCPPPAQEITYLVGGLDIDYNWATSYCPDAPVYLKATLTERPSPTGPITYEWYDTDDALLVSGTGNYTSETFHPTGDVSYKLTGRTTLCEKTIQGILDEVNTDITLDAPPAICPGNHLLITADVEATSGDNYYITWSKQGLSDSIPLPMPQSGELLRDKPIEPTTYTATYQRSGSGGVECYNTATAYIGMYPLPQIVNIEELEPKYVQFFTDFGTPAYQYSIDTKDDFSTSTYSDRLRLGLHTVYVRDANNCEASAQFNIEPPELIFPSFFSPNDDGRNDSWEIGNIDVYDEMELLIYDRFGKKLVNIKDTQGKGWDGSVSGKLQPSTDYWYVLTIKETGKQYVGHFTLLR